MEFIIHPVHPYDFELSTKIFFSDESIRRYENNQFSQLITVNDKPILVVVKSIGTVDNPKLSVNFKSNEELSEDEAKIGLEIINKIFNLDFDLKPFYEGVKSDEIMYKLTKKLKGLKSPVAASVFEALVLTIIEQQISLKAAHSIERRMIKKFGSTLKRGSHIYYAFPTPKQLNNALYDELKECGLTLRKTEYIKSISNDIENGKLDLEKLNEYKSINKVITKLCKIRGIGLWTAEFVMLRGLNRLESIPADDIGIRRVISHYYCNEKKITSYDARKIAQNWEKWKGLASFYLIIAEMVNVKI
ncbi:DNA-3-methyladenine glycosylase family protein [Methanobacterium sp. ACI-7]|uniref:DNA-3-methyladenine glycosylase family protein n=1 Tax=unclassified Methanobacterium TaxID=2627676 RepID=UPI0039C0C98E